MQRKSILWRSECIEKTRDVQRHRSYYLRLLGRLGALVKFAVLFLRNKRRTRMCRG